MSTNQNSTNCSDKISKSVSPSTDSVISTLTPIISLTQNDALLEKSRNVQRRVTSSNMQGNKPARSWRVRCKRLLASGRWNYNFHYFAN